MAYLNSQSSDGYGVAPSSVPAGPECVFDSSDYARGMADIMKYASSPSPLPPSLLP